MSWQTTSGPASTTAFASASSHDAHVAEVNTATSHGVSGPYACPGDAWRLAYSETSSLAISRTARIRSSGAMPLRRNPAAPARSAAKRECSQESAAAQSDRRSEERRIFLHSARSWPSKVGKNPADQDPNPDGAAIASNQSVVLDAPFDYNHPREGSDDLFLTSFASPVDEAA